MILRLNKRESYSALVRLITRKANECNTSRIRTPLSAATPPHSAINNLKKPANPKYNDNVISTSQLHMVRANQKRISSQMKRRKTYEKLKINSYLGVCVDVGQINRAFNLLVKYSCPKPNHIIGVEHYNIVLKGWAKLSSITQINETRMNMVRNNIEPNAETFAYILLGYTKCPTINKSRIKKLVQEMKSRDIDPRTLFQATYLSLSERKAIKGLLNTIDPKYDDIFCTIPIEYDCKLMERIKELELVPYDFGGTADVSKLEQWADQQRAVEWKSSITIKSVANIDEPHVVSDRYNKIWNKLIDIWRKTITKSLDESLKTLQEQCATADKIHLYPYLCSVDKSILVHLMMDEIETNAAFSTYSFSTNYLHSQFGIKVMTRYLRAKAIADGSHQEKQKIYNEYLTEYCSNPGLMGKMNSREYFQWKAIETKNYSIYRDRFAPVEQWPHHIVSAVGRFLYGIILREVKFDPESVRNPKREIRLSEDKMVHAFYTAYFQIDWTHKIKEEFRAHRDFEKLHQKACASRLRFDYSYLPTCSPPLPWLSLDFGGYLTNKADLVRVANPCAEQAFIQKRDLKNQKLYPSLDSVNALGLCPWIVNKDILDIVIDLFRSGGDADLTVPLDESKMEATAPVLSEGASKADRILYIREKKKYDQKRKEMYSLWRDCLYRLSIANHFRDKIFWFPHNMDFRGRTYPIPPHFNHLGSDLARSLLLFAKGQPLGEKGLDWLKIHLINLVGKMKSASLQERLEHANSILHLEVLDSADNPWDGRRWWTHNENPWQVLACCKEIAKAIRSRDFKQYISHFPVHQDGSCNGLQHYAALGRDPGGALAVNLVPSEKPQDVYSRVVDIVENMRKRDADQGDKIAQMLEGFIQRKVIKQTVMTTVYGVTRYGARQQIARQLVAKGYPDKDVWKSSHYLTSKTFESIGQMFNKSRLIQDWFNDCAYLIASKCRRPVSWETPLGFPVTQPYTMATISTNRLLSSSFGLDAPLYNDPLSQLNASKQKTAFPPNYIHSLDSSHMMLTSLYCQRKGITFVSVHDCYWTHPNTVDLMNRICREQFVALHSEPLLQDLSEQFVSKFIFPSAHAKASSLTDDRPDQFQINKLRVSSSPVSDSDDRLVDEDLKLLMSECASDDESQLEEKEEPHTIIGLYNSSREASQARTSIKFKDLPKTGDLDLKVVLDSTYFFS